MQFVKTTFYSIWLAGEKVVEQFTAAQWDKDQWHPFMEPLWFIKSCSYVLSS
jgi:alpha-L-fucosidase